MENENFVLPELITLTDYSGNFTAFLEAVYDIFKTDFILNKPKFRGIRIGLKKYPLINGKEYTFYHITHEGTIESERLPNLRRMERIRWPKVLIEKNMHPYLKVWKNKRKGDCRILIFHEEENYLVVLSERREYILLWTAYLIDRNHTKRKLLKEYEEFKNANAAQ